MQKLIIISGSPCVGKTTVSDHLFSSLENSAFLDGDWVWCVNPFSIEDPRLRESDKNMSFVLNTYLTAKFDYVVFSTVVATYPSIRENILSNIEYKDYEVIGFTLTCSRETLVNRHRTRGDQTEVSFHWLDLEAYPGDIIIDTDNKSIEEISKEIYAHVMSTNVLEGI